MQECGLSTALQQLKLKVTKLTQTQVTPFKDEMPRNSWWYWVQGRLLKLTIRLTKRLKVCRTKGSTNETCKSFY
jgi:hypothetical protein